MAPEKDYTHRSWIGLGDTIGGRLGVICFVSFGEHGGLDRRFQC